MRLRFRLYALVATAMLPVAVLLFHNHVERAETRERAAGDAVLDHAAGLASSLGQVVIGMKYTLVTLSRAPVMQSGDVERCRQYAASLRALFPETIAIGAADLSGSVYCNSLARASASNISDREYFRSALANGGFTVGEVVSGRVTGERSLTFAHPLSNPEGKPTGVLFAAIGLTQLSAQLSAGLQDGGYTRWVVDSDGVVVVDLSGARSGERLADDWRALIHADTPLGAEVRDGARRYIAGVVPVSYGGMRLYAVAARDREAVLADVAAVTRRDLALVGLATALMLLLTWIVTRLYLERPAQELLAAAGAWREGDFAARAPAQGSSEFGVLARAFNAMAQAGQTRQQVADAARQSMVEMRNAADRANRSKSQLLAALSHDLRLPLTGLRLNLSHAETEPLSNVLKVALARMKRSTVVIEELLDSIDDLSLIEAGQFKPRLECFPVAVLLDALAEEFGPTAASVQVGFNVEPSNAQIMSDARLLGRVLRNLISNAIKFTEPGGRIVVSVEEHPGSVGIAVRDTGIGIPWERQDEIFEEFCRLDPRGRNGLGLGLAIVKRLCDLLGHRVELRSTPGKGSTFKVRVRRGQAVAPLDSVAKG